MKKIPTLFERDWDGDRRYVLPEVTPGCEWVINGDGIPTRKYDGTCVMFDGEIWWARREIKMGKSRPAGFVAIEIDPETGNTVGWESVGQSSFARWLDEAVAEMVSPEDGGPWPIGTYELIGPKVNGNPEGYETHFLMLHDAAQIATCTGCPGNPCGHGIAPRDFDGLAAWLHAHPYEGIVWHHPDGRMAKIKKRDFRAPDRERP